MKRARIETHTEHAPAVAASIRPDNTPEITTRTDGDTVITVIERETTSGLRATVDDYLVNLSVAIRLTDQSPTPLES